MNYSTYIPAIFHVISRKVWLPNTYGPVYLLFIVNFFFLLSNLCHHFSVSFLLLFDLVLKQFGGCCPVLGQVYLIYLLCTLYGPLSAAVVVAAGAPLGSCSAANCCCSVAAPNCCCCWRCFFCCGPPQATPLLLQNRGRTIVCSTVLSLPRLDLVITP